MFNEPRVQQLLDEIFDAGRTPEDVCRDYPELLTEVRQRCRQMRHVEARLDLLFPSSDVVPDGDTPAAARHSAAILPTIPGYEIEGVLGRGGMGIVYKARQVRLNRMVALKMLLAGAYAAPDERARFAREAEAVGGLKHANIVQVYDVGDHEGRPFFTMEYVEGGSLAEVLLGQPRPAQQAAAMLTILTEAVRVAHRDGVVHRDLKPANILLGADGTPKIADFGLARHFNVESSLTLSGARLGTPSYMSPEQAKGELGAVGPASDIYSLGAILYELLTGRPPFRADTSAETQQQVISDDPVAPTLLNRKVPRDLETICLKCLQKEPQGRYTSAAELADDLNRFQRGEPIRARPASPLERLAKWARRRPAQAATLAASLVVSMGLVAAGLWFVDQQTQQRHAIEADLRDLGRLRDSARWADARLALKRAESQPSLVAAEDLRQRLAQARRDLDLAAELDGIRLNRVTRGELDFYKAQADKNYAQIFRRAGLDGFDEECGDVARKINASAVRGALVAAVYDWAVCAPDRTRRTHLLELSRQLDPTPDDWRQRALDPAAWEDRRALIDLADAAPVAQQPVPLLLAVGERLRAVNADSLSLLKRVQAEHPADFWTNLILGNAILQWAPKEAVGYFRAALASRPQAAVGYCGVGDASRLQQSDQEAAAYYQKALELDPGYARAHSNLGLVLQSQGRLDEAIRSCRLALAFDPDYAWAHCNLASTLRWNSRLSEALDHYQQALKLDPGNSEAAQGIRSLLVQSGRGDEARLEWRKTLDAGSAKHQTWHGYLELCLFLDKPEEYRAARKILLDRFGRTASPAVAEPIARACLLAPGTAEEIEQAAALAELAVNSKNSAPEWVFRYYLFAKGLAEFRQDRFTSAESIMEGEASGVLGPCPRLVAAMAQFAQGNKGKALETLARAVLAFDWSASEADNRDVWIAHLLRREAEAMILPNLPAFVRGEYQPQDNDERLALVGHCESEGRYYAAARLYADARAADSSVEDEFARQCRQRLALEERQPTGRLEDLACRQRYPLARCAALAGTGHAADGTQLSPLERARLRQQALDLLQADLARWSEIIAGGSPSARIVARRTLTHWKCDLDLAAVREGKQLAKLPDDERAALVALWHELDALLASVN